MKKEFIQSIKIIVLGLVLSVGISFVYAQLDPLRPADFNTNLAGPVNALAKNQIKDGDLSVKGFSVIHGARFNQNVMLGTELRNLSIDYDRSICANTDGKIKICGNINSFFVKLSVQYANGSIFTNLPGIICTPEAGCNANKVSCGPNCPHEPAAGSYGTWSSVEQARVNVIFSYPTKVQVTAEAEADSYFLKWWQDKGGAFGTCPVQECPCHGSTNSMCEVTVSNLVSTISTIAVFDRKQYPVKVLVNGIGQINGTCSSPQNICDLSSLSIECGNGALNCTRSYYYGANVPLTATASQGQHFVSWGGTCASSGSSPVCNLDLTYPNSPNGALVNVTATFAPN